MLTKLRATLAVIALSSATSFCFAQESMTNESVLHLQKAGLSEELIVQTINGSAGHYDTSTDAIIKMKTDGITDKEIGAMLSKNANPNGPPAAPTYVIAAAPAGPVLPNGVDEVGVYFKDPSGAWANVISENVNFKTGGFLKSLATDGIVKGDINGHLTGSGSKLHIDQPATFIIYVLEGQSPGEYQLLHLHTHSDGREFRSVTGGVIHASSGAERDTTQFDTKKIAPRVYQVILPANLAVGEYGFLPPMTQNSGKNMASLGKMYTFNIPQ